MSLFVLPPNWQVLVTSRVLVSNATILSVETLKEKSAIYLARTYIAKRGGDPIDEATYIKLTSGCHYNPLAIRLTLDYILTGRSLPESLNVANKEIAEFSYNNLIEVLSKKSINILEAIFVEDTSSRLSLCELLGMTLDEVSTAIGELGKTSLISRKSTEQGEVYSLSDSVRELLLVSPKNIDARSKVQELINKRRMLSKQIDIKQSDQDIPIWNSDFVPKETNENLKILVTEVNKKIRKAKNISEIAVSLYKKLQEAKFFYEDSELYHRAFARVCTALKDINGAERHYKIAVSLNSNDVASKYLLARLYHDTKRYDEAFDIYQSLIDDGWTAETPEATRFGSSIYQGYFLALVYSGQYDHILDLTKRWKESENYRGILGTYRASAWKRRMENLVEIDPDETINSLMSASRIMSDIFRNDGYLKQASTQARKLFEEIEFCFSRENYCKTYPQEGQELLDFIADNIFEIGDASGDYNNKLIERLCTINIQGNPFKSTKWKAFSKPVEMYDEFDTDSLESRGLVSVKITNRPKEQASFLFARDSSGEDFFLHYDNLKNGNWQDWCKLSIGVMLDIVPDHETHNPNKATNTKEIYMLDTSHNYYG